jgi:DNA-binding NtrC family response regulator
LRADLYYRINVLTFHLPPLRERPQDIGPLARAFAAHYSARFDKPISDISAETMVALEAYPWPGNVRQLDNVIQQMVLAADGHELTVFDLPAVVRQSGQSFIPRSEPPPAANKASAPVPGRTDALRFANSLGQSKADYERHLIRKALENSRFNRSSAARALGVSRVTLHKKIKQYGLSDLW